MEARQRPGDEVKKRKRSNVKNEILGNPKNQGRGKETHRKIRKRK